jgi:hypothetical protein
MEVRNMPAISRRRITVTIGFIAWLGAAALVCGTLAPDQLAAERQATLADPTAVVRVQVRRPAPIAPPISLADR